jgi:hypothetical protein
MQSPSITLAGYAAQHWVGHTQFEDVASHIKGMEYLFNLDKPYFVHQENMKKSYWT